MITSTTLASPAIQARLYAGLRFAVRMSRSPEVVRTLSSGMHGTRKSFGSSVYIPNRYGLPFIRCDHIAGEGFRFYGNGSRDITSMVLQSLRG